MSWNSIFYWITRADDIKGFFDTFSNWFLFFTIIFGLAYIFLSIFSADPESKDSWESIKYWKKSIGKCLGLTVILTTILWAGYVFTPTKKEALLIVAGGGAMKFLTTDSSAKRLPSELTTFVITELRSMSEQAKVDIGINQTKKSVLDEIRGLSATELIEKMKSDSTLTKIILNK